MKLKFLAAPLAALMLALGGCGADETPTEALSASEVPSDEKIDAAVATFTEDHPDATPMNTAHLNRPSLTLPPGSLTPDECQKMMEATDPVHFAKVAAGGASKKNQQESKMTWLVVVRYADKDTARKAFDSTAEYVRACPEVKLKMEEGTVATKMTLDDVDVDGAEGAYVQISTTDMAGGNTSVVTTSYAIAGDVVVGAMVNAPQEEREAVAAILGKAVPALG